MVAADDTGLEVESSERNARSVLRPLCRAKDTTLRYAEAAPRTEEEIGKRNSALPFMILDGRISL